MVALTTRKEKPLMQFSLAKFLSDIAADTAAIQLDAPGGFYDRFHEFLERSTQLSDKSKAGCRALIARAFAIHSILKQQIGSGPVSGFVKSVGGSFVRQQARRTLDHHARPETRGDALLEVDTATRSKLLGYCRELAPEERSLFERIIRDCDAERLRAIAELSLEDLKALLPILGRPSMVQSAVRSACEGFATASDQLRRWSGRPVRQRR